MNERLEKAIGEAMFRYDWHGTLRTIPCLHCPEVGQEQNLRVTVQIGDHETSMLFSESQLELIPGMARILWDASVVHFITDRAREMFEDFDSLYPATRAFVLQKVRELHGFAE